MSSEGSGVDVKCRNSDCDYETVVFPDEDTPKGKIIGCYPDALTLCPECPSVSYLMPTMEVGDG